jgi:hypothetical protein
VYWYLLGFYKRHRQIDRQRCVSVTHCYCHYLSSFPIRPSFQEPEMCWEAVTLWSTSFSAHSQARVMASDLSIVLMGARAFSLAST